jgi:hypothetical protein
VINWRENTTEAELQKARLTIFEMEFFTQPQYQYFVTSFLTNTLFVFKQISVMDINAVGSAAAFERAREKAYWARLGVGEATVRLPDRWRFLFLIHTEDLRKDPVSDGQIAARVPEHVRAVRAQVLEPYPISTARGIKED